MFYMNHPAPGFGDLLPGFFVLPQNPFAQGPERVPGIGDILPARFIVPQNPLRKELGMSGNCGCGCGGSGGCGKGNGEGIGFVNGIPFHAHDTGGMGNIIDDVSGQASQLWDQVTAGGTGTYVALGAGALLLMLLSRGSGGSAYQQELRKLRQKYPTRARRLRGAVESY